MGAFGFCHWRAHHLGIAVPQIVSKRLRFLPLAPGGHSDKVLLSLAISLAAFGLVMVYSASYIFSQEKVGDGLYYFNKHIVFLVIGFIAMTICRFVDYRFWKKASPVLFFGSLGLVALTLIPGVAHKALGASRWINLGGFTLQPVELSKITLVMFMAMRLTREGQEWNKITTGFLQHLWPPVLMVGLCMLQPDFGSSALVITTTAFMLYLSGVRFKYLAGAAAAVAPMLVAAMLLAPYRRARVMTFLDPWADPQGSGFQIVQSFIAFYRGGLFGAGLGNSRAKVFYLPEAHNDFILSVVGEELGFIGIGILSAAFLFLIFRGIRVSAKADSKYGSVLAAGLTILLGLSVFWNAAIVLGLFPTKGMNMPFISSGGTSVLCTLSIVGILLNISAQAKKEGR
jgi:cell division protein FtsW